MPLSEEVVADYQMLRLSLKAHPMALLRRFLPAPAPLSAAGIATAADGARARMAGIVTVRQRPGKGNAIFITLEDETGITNVLLWARLFERQRRPAMAARLMLAEGTVQRSPEGVVHLIATRVIDLSALLGRLSEGAAPTLPARNGHPRLVRVLPRSRDFH
jgi:error-prone DNA polymerase